ncbi:MAG: GntR family transcriptional regulator [Acidobacteria bacterium]|nr:GntR family transcriptional regulator [Acidobacteriota bacterium]
MRSDVREGTEATSLAAEVYGVVRRRILRGDLMIGEVISRRAIAADLSTSLPPVTEALLRLEYEGLLEHRPRAGTRVRIPSPEDVRGHFIVREALEVQAAIRFTQVATAHERAELRRLAMRADALAAQPDRQAHASLHQRLHRWIAEGSRCPALCEAIDRTCALAAIWIPTTPHPAGEIVLRHQVLAHGVVSGNPAVAAQAMRDYLTACLERTLEAVEETTLRVKRPLRQSFARGPRRRHPTGTGHITEER